MDINQEVIERAARNLRRILATYSGEIAEAFLKADDELKVGLSLEFSPKGSGIKIKTGINFIESRVKDSDEDEIYPPDPIALANERIAAERALAAKIGNTPGTWARLRGYRHR